MRAPRRGESGVVLVVVLVFALLLASTVATFVRRATVDRMIAHNREAAARAEALARGGVRFATVLILEDKLQSQDGGSALDTGSDLWSLVGNVEIPIDESSSLRIHVEDASQKLNLNAVFQLDENGVAHENAAPMLEAILEKVIEEMPIPPAEKLWDVSELVANLIDYADRDDLRLRGGAEDDVYQRRDPPQRAANRTLLSLEELRVVEGFDARLVEALRPYLTVYPYGGQTGINLNTAPPHVLALLFFDDGVELRLAQEDTVREILKEREEERHICPEGQASEECTPIRQIVTNAIYPPPTFESNVFVARVEASVSGVRRTIEAVIDRKVGAEPLLLSWRVL